VFDCLDRGPDILIMVGLWLLVVLATLLAHADSFLSCRPSYLKQRTPASLATAKAKQRSLAVGMRKDSTASKQHLNFLAGVPLVLFNPLLAHASSAHESLRLLDGYQTRIPDNVTWVALIVVWGTVQYKISRFQASL
jgi:hypothetical protein